MPEPAPAPLWPGGWALPLVESDAVTAPTRDALTARLDALRAAPRVLDADAFALLRAACARLVPSTGLAAPVDVAGDIDARLARGGGDGWRYATLPPDVDAFRLGLAALDAAAKAAHAARFVDLTGEQQDAVLADAQNARGDEFAGFDAAQWFEDWLAEAAGLFYAHPVVQESIGYAGFADSPGWTRIGLGEREDREPEPLDSRSPAP